MFGFNLHIIYKLFKLNTNTRKYIKHRHIFSNQIARLNKETKKYEVHIFIHHITGIKE